MAKPDSAKPYLSQLNPSEVDGIEDRRKFLAACGKFAVVTPPAITLLLSTSLSSSAVAGSGGGRGGRDPGCDHDRSR